jgi:DNA-binding CsgD family transcriptional regulator
MSSKNNTSHDYTRGKGAGREDHREDIERLKNEKQAMLEGLKGLVTIRYMTPDLRIIWSNLEATDQKGPSSFCYELLRGRSEPCAGCEVREALSTGRVLECEEKSPAKDQYFIARVIPLKNSDGAVTGVIHVALNVTARKSAERELTEREAELNMKSRQLEETNTALRVLLRQREEDLREVEERIVSNVKELVFPYIHKLRGMHLNEAQANFVEIIGTHLNHIVAPFLRDIVSQYPHMTAREIQVATLIREGKSNKEIADLMSVSLNTIEIHRYNLRHKLGLRNKKVNLRSYLLSLNKLP